MDAPDFLLYNGQHEEVDHSEFILKDNPIQEEKEEEEDEVEKKEELNEESEGYQISEVTNE